MQYTYDVDTPNFECPDKLPVKDVQFYVHPSSMAVTHDYSCPVCREEHAVVNGSTGVMGPCWGCRAAGWQIKRIDRRSWWKQFFNIGAPYASK